MSQAEQSIRPPLKEVPKSEPIDPNDLAKAEALVNQARQEDQQKRFEAIRKVFEEQNAEPHVEVQIGNQWVPAVVVLNLPTRMGIKLK